MKTLQPKQLKELKHSLMTEKNDLERHFRAKADRDGENLTDSTGELSSYDNHPADLGTETFERERDMAVDESMEDQLERVDAALRRMDEGTYGICRVCGKRIPFERLQALPSADTCVKDASDEVIDGGRPVEEQVMTPPPRSQKDLSGRSDRFDQADAWKDVERYGNSSETVSPDDEDDSARDLTAR